MRKLLILIAKNYVLLGFLALEFLSFSLILNANYYQNSNFYSWTNQQASFLHENINSIRNYFLLKKVNESLLETNTKILIDNQYIIRSKKSNIMQFSDDSDIQFDFFSAFIVNNSFIKKNNYITIDKGSLHGFRKGMGAFTEDGIVGIVQHVSSNYSVLLSVLHSQIDVSAKLLNGNFGSVKWDGVSYKYCKLNYIPKHINIDLGDSVVTTGYSSVFPEGILIGVISNIDTTKNNSFYDLTVKLSNDMTNISHVYIIANKFQEEKNQIENNE